MRAETGRAIARDVLIRVEVGAYSNIVLPQILRDSKLDGRDRAFVTDLVYGTLRRRRSLDHLLALVSDRPVDRLDAPVRAALRLGAYQLVSGVPAHAAVSETVEVAPLRARGYVNAALRKLARLGPPWPWPDGADTESLAVRLSYPDWIVQRLRDELGPDDGRAALEAGNEAPRVTLRPNPERTSSAALATELQAEGVHVEPGRLVGDALVVRGIGDPARLAAVADGRATPQDQASQAVVQLLDPQPGETVVDLAAAPGGKATATGERVGGAGRVVAIDLRAGRAALVAAAARRLRLHQVFPVVADGTAPPVRAASADRVLVDAPCTGLGVLGRRADARFRVAPSDVEPLAALQRELLRAAGQLVRSGGVVVYSVCTLTGEETIGIDEWTARALPELVATTRPGPPWRPRGRGALLLPQDAGTDGMYVLRLVRQPS